MKVNFNPYIKYNKFNYDGNGTTSKPTETQLPTFEMKEYLNNKFEFKNITFNGSISNIKGINKSRTNLEKNALTKYLEEHYTNADEMIKIIDKNPNLCRNVGLLPDSWLAGIEPENFEQTTEKIYKSISKFQKANPLGYKGDTTELSDDIGKILKKETQIEYIDGGENGCTYKISVDGCEPVALKDYKRTNFAKIYYMVHGQYIEPQNALYINAHSNDYVKMYFGRVSSPNKFDDGFIVTQFLSDDIEPVSTKTMDNADYIFCCTDDNPQNIINGKIIDFGQIIFEPIKI